METEHSQQFQELLSTNNSAFVLSVQRAYSPDSGLERSTSQIRFTRSTLCSSSAESLLLSVVHSPHSAIRHTH
jgi:hypothetical protein